MKFENSAMRFRSPIRLSSVSVERIFHVAFFFFGCMIARRDAPGSFCRPAPEDCGAPTSGRLRPLGGGAQPPLGFLPVAFFIAATKLPTRTIVLQYEHVRLHTKVPREA